MIRKVRRAASLLRASVFNCQRGVTCGSRVSFGTECMLLITGHGQLRIGDNTSIGDRVHIEVGSGDLTIEANVSIASGCILRTANRATALVGEGTHIFERCLIEAHNGRLEIGPGSHISMGCVLSAMDRVSTGSGFQAGEYVSMRDHDHVLDLPPSTYSYNSAPISIGSDVWLAAKVTVTRGVTIGDGAVVGANAVVTHDVAPATLVAGVPARVVRSLDRSSPRSE